MRVIFTQNRLKHVARLVLLGYNAIVTLPPIVGIGSETSVNVAGINVMEKNLSNDAGSRRTQCRRNGRE